MSFVSIGIKTSIPVTAPAATSGAVTFSSIDDENWLQISGDASAGSGSLYLLRWYPDLAEWRVYMEDKPMSVNSATFSGQFSGHYPFPSREESFVLYDPAAAITATASCARTSSPLTALSVTMASTLPTGAATAAKQDTGNTSLATIATQQTDGTQKTQVTGSVAVTGPLTDAQLRVAAVPVSAAALPLPSGAATAAKQPALGTAGTPSADVLSVQGVVGGIAQPISAAALPLPSGAATEATLGLLTLAQNSTTGGQSGPLMMGAVTTNAPNYLNSRTQPFSLDTSGGMRVAGYNTPATAQANPTNAVPTQAFMMVWNGATWDRLLSEGISADADNAPSAGTVSSESYTMMFNGTAWDRARVGGDNSTNPTLGKQYVIPARANAAAPSWTESNAVPLSATLFGAIRSTVTDGTNTMPTMDAAARSGYHRVTDGTNTAAVKAASTAAAASDPSMVVAVSPNSPATVVGATATGTAVSGNPVLIAGQDGTNTRTMRLDTTGRPAGSSFQWRGAATSELLKSGAGVLRRVICGSNVAGTITLYDNTSATGTVIVSLTTTTSTPFNSVEINAAFSTGLYAVSTGMSGGSYTIVWD